MLCKSRRLLANMQNTIQAHNDFLYVKTSLTNRFYAYSSKIYILPSRSYFETLIIIILVMQCDTSLKLILN